MFVVFDVVVVVVVKFMPGVVDIFVVCNVFSLVTEIAATKRCQIKGIYQPNFRIILIKRKTYFQNEVTVGHRVHEYIIFKFSEQNL